jgi:hypothetical protein
VTSRYFTPSLIFADILLEWSKKGTPHTWVD